MSDIYKYQDKYLKENCKCISFRLNKKYDKELIEHIEKQDNKAEFFKRLIREDMQNKQK